MLSYRDREEKFQHWLNRWPEPGEVLVCLDGVPAEVTVMTYPGSGQSLNTAAVIDNACTGWYLSLQPRGVMVMIDLDSHQQVLERAAELGPKVTVERLRVLRRNRRGTALICEYVEDADE
jgi:hypothetical protein